MSKKSLYGKQNAFSLFEDTMVDMTRQEIRVEAERDAIVLLPIGTIESRGPHLDLSADTCLSTLYCRFLRQELMEKGLLYSSHHRSIGVSAGMWQNMQGPILYDLRL